MKTGKAIFESLKGIWIFERKISENGVVKGKAIFEEVKPDILNYREKGTWLRLNQTFEISKEYQYQYHPENDKITVFFSDKPLRVFYEMNFISFADEKDSGHVSATGKHLCKKDTYKAQYKFINKNKFLLFYHVIGPKKNYTSETVFESQTYRT